MLRQKDLCPTPAECPEVLMEDPLAGTDALPCPHCPQQALTTFLGSPAGSLISVVIDLDFAIQAGLSVALTEITYPEFLLLRQLADERAQYEKEQIEKRKN